MTYKPYIYKGAVDRNYYDAINIMIDFIYFTPPFILILAFLLDIAIGDPRGIPHPVRIMGFAISKIEAFMRRYFFNKKIPLEKFGGIILVILIVAPVFVATYLLQKAVFHYSLQPSASGACSLTIIGAILGIMLLIYFTSTTIALRELITSARDVIKPLNSGDIKTARQKLAMIVGRETKTLSEKEISIATVETVSENLSDGIIAPIFYFSIGGLPFAMAYKAINTLDSMVGYKNCKYKDFGWASAKLDDIANYVPARITGILISISSLAVSRSLLTAVCSLKTMISDGKKHPSPNSGVPEASMAGAIGIRMGGPSTYDGVIVKKPFIGKEINNNENYKAALEMTLSIAKITSFFAVAIATAVLFIRI